MKIISEILKEVEELRFPEESFKKFNDPADTQYEDYGDRKHEEWHDRGWNNAIDHILKILR